NVDLTHTGKKAAPVMVYLRRSGVYLGLVSLAAALLLWELVARYGGYPTFMLPAPALVWARFIQSLQDGSLLTHTAVTLLEIVAGLALGVSAASLLGYLLAKSVSVERLLSPYIVASQSVPIVAIAPLLVIWFGPGLFSKVLICALIVFFPVLVSMIVGLRSVPEELHDLMRSLQATRWQTARYLEIPSALPVMLGGLRIGATLAVIGAVVGEFAGSNQGLGFLINVGRSLFDTSLVFVAVFTLIIMALGLYGSVLLLERRLLSWQRRPDEPVLTDL
ncbi:MAG: ABC transporter permease, partial [Anaerolineales bacterium]